MTFIADYFDLCWNVFVIFPPVDLYNIVNFAKFDEN